MKIKLAHVLFALLMVIGADGYAQGNSNGKRKNPPVPFGPPHPELPIDAGVSLLLIAGSCYGAFKLRQK